MTVVLTSCAICRAEMHPTAVKCEACGAEERLVKQDENYMRAKRIKVRNSPVSY